jgi:AraC-like DNA-binding protein
VQAKLFIDSHFSENLDLDNIADEACFSKFHFIRLFKTIYGYTPHQYLIKARIENAKKLLEEKNTVTEVCFAVGFSSVSSFAGLFKKITRHSPSAYQQEFKRRRLEITRKPLQFIPACFASQKGWTEISNFEEVL